MDVSIAQRLMERRKQAGYTQETLAEKLGVSRQAVSKWERSESSPDTDNLIALAQLYGVSLDDLLFAEVRKGEAADAEEEGVYVVKTESESARAAEDEASDASEGESCNGADSGSGNAVGAEEKPLVASEEGDEIRLSSDALHFKSASGEEVVLSKGGGVAVSDATGVITRHFGSLREAHDAWRTDHGGEPCGYTVRGEYFETLDAARKKYGAEIDAGEPVRKHYASRFVSAWSRFPYPLLALLGAAMSLTLSWAPSTAINIPSGYYLFIWPGDVALFWIATIPLYYLLGRAIDRRRPLSFVAEAYAVTVIVLMVPSIGQGVFGAVWPLLLTVPLVAWLAHACERRIETRKNSRNDDGVDADSESSPVSDNT